MAIHPDEQQAREEFQSALEKFLSLPEDMADNPMTPLLRATSVDKIMKAATAERGSLFYSVVLPQLVKQLGLLEQQPSSRKGKR